MVYKNSFLIDSKLIRCFSTWRNRSTMHLPIIARSKGLANFFLVLDKSSFNLNRVKSKSPKISRDRKWRYQQKKNLKRFNYFRYALKISEKHTKLFYYLLAQMSLAKKTPKKPTIRLGATSLTSVTLALILIKAANSNQSRLIKSNTNI